MLSSSVFFFHLSLQLTAWVLSTLRRAVCFTQSTDFKVNLIQKHTHRHSQSSVWSNAWAPCGPVNLTHKINHHYWWQRRKQWHPTPVLLPGKSHGQRSLVGCSPWGPWGHWGLDTTERLHFHFSLLCIGEENGNPLQYSCLENPRDGGAWWAAVYWVAQSRTWLKRLSSSSIGDRWASLVAQTVKRLPTMQETRVWSLGQEDPLEKEMATHSNIHAWKIPWTEEPGGLQSMGSQRVGHDWATSLQFTSSRCEEAK